MEMRQSILIAICSMFLLGAAPSRTQTYTAGEVIDPSDVTENEDNIFSYLQAGVDTVRNNAVETADIQDAAVTSAKIGTGAVTTTGILDGTITTSDLNATLTFSDNDFVDMSAMNVGGTSEGLTLPQATSCASCTAEGQLCWDTDDDALSTGSGTVAQIGQTVKAWCKFDGSAITPSCSDSFNVSSITDNGTGDYTLNWTVAFASANYVPVCTTDRPGTDLPGICTIESMGTGSVRVNTRRSTVGTVYDAVIIAVLAIGDQ